MSSRLVVAKGLEDVVVAESRLSYVYGAEGRLIYRGYDIFDLAAHSTFEEIAYLMWYGKLPAANELASISRKLAENRNLPQDIIDKVLRCLPASAHPMDALRSVASVLGIFDPQIGDPSPEAILNKSIRLVAKFPTIIASFERIRRGQDPVDPDPSLNHAANFLYMLEGKRPDDWTARVFEVCLILHVDHGFNASTFSARVTASTLADIYAAVTSATGTLKGPLHGGANEKVMAMLEEIRDPENVEPYVRKKLEEKQRIMGFGHRVYKAEDPRATILRKLAHDAWNRQGDLKWFEIQRRIEKLILQEKKLYPNVDFYSATVYKALNIPLDLYTPIFAMARVVGWTAHIIEQYEDNRLIRPRAEYVGETGRAYAPIENR